MTSSTFGSPAASVKSNKRSLANTASSNGVRKSSVSPRLIISHRRTSPDSDASSVRSDVSSRSPSPSYLALPEAPRRQLKTQRKAKPMAQQSTISTPNARIRYKFVTESTSDQNMDSIKVDNDTMVTKIVTITMTTTTIVSRTIPRLNSDVSQPIESEQPTSDYRGIDSSLGCSCGHLSAHQAFHLQHHQQTGAKIAQKA